MPEYDPIYLTLNDKPRAIVAAMDNMVSQRKEIEESSKKRRKVPLWVFLAGFPFVLIDLAFFAAGYRVCVFSLITVVCWIAALVLLIAQRRGRTLELPPLYDAACKIIYTLRDDLKLKQNFNGHLDLTGTQIPEKVARETSDTLGRTTQYYRDEWLGLKAKLYDGNILRVSAFKRAKNRQGYWKRSTISGKMKWKGPKFKGTLQELKVRLTVNPQAYEIIASPALAPGVSIGSYIVSQIDTTGGIINLVARSSGEEISPDDVLGVLKSAYELLKWKA